MIISDELIKPILRKEREVAAGQTAMEVKLLFLLFLFYPCQGGRKITFAEQNSRERGSNSSRAGRDVWLSDNKTCHSSGEIFPYDDSHYRQEADRGSGKKRARFSD